MKGPEKTAKTFKAMQRLSPEVSFQQVEVWVRKTVITADRPPNRWLPLFIARFLYKRSAN